MDITEVLNNWNVRNAIFCSKALGEFEGTDVLYKYF